MSSFFWPATPPTHAIEVAGQSFSVLTDTPERMQEVAQLLARIREALMHFVTANCAPGSKVGPPDACLCEVAHKWDGGLRETNRGAYTVDKTTISMCTRSPRTGGLQTWDTCVFVALHELAHIATDHIGHTPQFWENFAHIVKLARADKLFDPALVGACYCGESVGAMPTPASLSAPVTARG